MNSFIFKVKAHKVAIIGATIGATAALRIVLFLLKKRKETPKTKEIEQETTQTNPKESAYFQKARIIGANITPRTIGNTKNYDMNTISQVLEQSIELAAEDYVQVTLKNRQERRAVMDTDADAYERLVLEYYYSIEDVLKKAQQTILDVLNIQNKDFEQSIMDFMQKGHQQEIYMFQAAIIQKIKEKIDATKDITIEKTKEIIRFQIEILKKQPQLLKQVIQKLSTSPETIQLIPIIISYVLNDFVFKEFQVEEEDQIKFMARPALSSDHELTMLLQEIEQAMFALVMPFSAGMEGGL